MADSTLKNIGDGLLAVAKIGGDLAAIGIQVAKSIDNTQKTSLSFGTSVENTSKAFKESIDSLNGGFLVRVESVLDILSTGLETNSMGLMELVNSQKITNQDSKKTAKVFARMTAALGLNEEQLDDMSESLMESSKEYRVSTSRLINTFASLENTLGTQALLDMGPQLNTAVTKLVSEMPAAQKEINSFAQLILGTSDRANTERAKLGLDQDALRIRSAKTEEEARVAFIAAIVKVEEFTNQFDFLSDDNKTLNAVMSAYGQSLADAKIIVTNMGKREKTAFEDRINFEESLSTQLGNAFFTIQRELINMFSGPVIDAFTRLGEALGAGPDGNFSKFTTFLATQLENTVTKIINFDYTTLTAGLKEITDGPGGLLSVFANIDEISKLFNRAFSGPKKEPDEPDLPTGTPDPANNAIPATPITQDEMAASYFNQMLSFLVKIAQNTEESAFQMSNMNENGTLGSVGENEAVPPGG